MAKRPNFAPDSMPILSRGRHRTPRRGACFMELASYLAGERWSDHPPCTHPLLADLARRVNDLSSDAGRRALAPLIPSVIGRLGGGPEVDARIAWRCATTALPVVSAERQQLLALAVLTSAELLDDPRLEAATAEALAHVPETARRARLAIDRTAAHRSLAAFSRYGAPVAVRTAALGLAEACAPDVDGLLRGLLIVGIAECGGARTPAAPTTAAPTTSAPIPAAPIPAAPIMAFVLPT